MNKFWRDLLDEIKNRVSVNLQSELDAIGTPEEKQYPENVDKLKNFFQLIEKTSDLDGETEWTEEAYWEFIKAFVSQNPNDGVWNETVNHLVKTYKSLYDRIEHATVLESDKAYVDGLVRSTFIESAGQLYRQTFNTTDVKNGDAGNSFELNDYWVKPWYNTDPVESDLSAQKSYSTVRGDDKNNAALTSQENLQFTREQAQAFVEQIRLLMPKNSRRVQIEDLNRNFWVIAQILTAASAYLFGDDSPFNVFFDGALKELISLWENVLYQWGVIGTLLTPSKSLHKEFFALPNSAFQPYMKYDGFDGLNNLTYEQLLPIIKERVAYYKHKYTNSNLFLVPYIRYNNYEKNYYFRMMIPYICLYNSSDDKWYFHKVVDQSTGTYPIINPNDYADRMYGARETDLYYKYTYPLTLAATQAEINGPFRYYGALRPEMDVNLQMVSGHMRAINFSIKFYDGLQQVINKQNDLIFRYRNVGYQIWENDLDVVLARVDIKAKPDSSANIPFVEEKQKEAYYLGEMPSCYGLSSNKPNLVFQSSLRVIGEGKLIKIGNYLPQRAAPHVENLSYWTDQHNTNGGLTDYLWNLTITTQKQGADSNVVKAWYNNQWMTEVGSNSCYLYYPTVVNGVLRYATNQVLASQYTENNYKKLGQDCLTLYLNHTATPNAITYYIAAVGIRPWHNSREGYYANNILTHVFRFIPEAWEPYIDRKSDDINIFKDARRIGTLQTLGPINRIEKAFTKSASDDIFANPDTTWRLPQLVPETYLDQLLIYKETLTGAIYFVDRNKDSSLAYLSIDDLTQRINDQFNHYVSTGVIMTANDVRIQLREPSGRWEVYDGNVKNTTGNTHFYKRDNSLREVAYMNFKFNSNSNFGFVDPIRGRMKGDNTALSAKADGQDYGGSIILPYSGFDNMAFTW